MPKLQCIAQVLHHGKIFLIAPNICSYPKYDLLPRSPVHLPIILYCPKALIISWNCPNTFQLQNIVYCSESLVITVEIPVHCQLFLFVQLQIAYVNCLILPWSYVNIPVYQLIARVPVYCPTSEWFCLWRPEHFWPANLSKTEIQ